MRTPGTLALIASLLFSLEAGAAQNQQQQPLHTITGSVTNAATGEPIRRALVEISFRGQGATLTGADGRFQFDNVPEGTVWLNVQKPGFFSNPHEQSYAPNQFTVTSGANDFQLQLYPAAHITGTITDGNGQPLEGASVSALQEQIMQGRKQWMGGPGSITDEDGFFRIDELHPGRYVVFAAGHQLPTVNSNLAQEANPLTYYPDAPDRTSAQTIDLQPGQEFSANIHMRTERCYRITAFLAGLPAGLHPNVTLMNSAGELARAAKFDASRGHVVAEGIPSGTWTLMVNEGPRGLSSGFQGSAEITVDHADVTGLQVLVHSSVTIPIKIIEPGSDSPRRIGPNLQASLLSSSTWQTSHVASSRDSPPTLTFQNIPPGTYKLELTPFAGACIDSATYGSIDLLRDPLVISDGASQPITVTMGANCASLTVTVRPGDQPRSRISVLVVPSSSVVQPLRQDLSIPTPGVNTFSNQPLALSPGSYQVYAFNDLDSLEYANPEALRGYRSTRVTLDAGQKMEVAVDINERSNN